MKKDNVKDAIVENDVAFAPDPEQVLAHIVRREDGYHVLDLITNEEGPVCKLVDEGNKTIALTPNSSNRKWANKAKADAAIDEQGFFPLCYKATKVLGPSSARIPNEKLLYLLSEEEQAEYRAIFEEAKERMKAEKNKPVDPIEKLKAQIAKAQAKLAELEGGAN